MKKYCIALAVFVVTGPAFAGKLILTTEEYAPFNFVDPASSSNKVTGSATEILEAILTKTGTEYEIKMLPWQRAYSMAQSDPDTCVYSTTYTDERKPLFKWVGPLAANDWVIFAAADSTITLAKLEDAKGKKIGGYKGDAVADHLLAQGFTMELSATDRPNPKMLQAGRIDLWASSKQGAPYLAKSEGGIPIKEVFTIKPTELSLACSKTVDDALIAKLNGALEDLKKSGEAEKIYQRYR